MVQPISELQAILSGWKARPPSAVSQVDDAPAVTLGERHGSWFVRFTWVGAGLQRAAELAITNPTALEDSVATQAVISVRASATSETHWTATSIYDQRRSLSRVSQDDLDDWIAAAVRVASSYTAGSLTDVYTLPTAERA